MSKAVIIDDIQSARDYLKRDLLSFCPKVEVIGEADGVLSGLKLIKQSKPDIVFLDINMNDGTGFDILELLDTISFKVIFTTASDAYAIKAFKFSAIDYLLKPVDADELIKAVGKATEKGKESHQQNVGLLMDQMKSKEGMKKIALHTSDKIQICELEDIVRCESSVNYTTFYFKNDSKLMVTKTLKFYDQLLSQSGFLRVHQSHLINVSQIKEYIKSDGGYIVMNNGNHIPISARKKAEVIELISGIH